ncbi:MAG: DUF721 domain-containing protein [Bacteroidales bacterium]|nr:DUF721 domain-containing protein [Bacteroidales bacterium]
MYSNEHTLQDLLQQAFRRLDMDDTVTEIEVRRMYNALVGDLISRLTWKLTFKDGVLTAKMASAALRQELFYRRNSLMDKINDNLGRKAVKEIRFL